MRIEANHNLPGTKEVTATGSQSKPADKSDQAEFPAAAQLVRQLNATPEVRADRVARAKALIANPAYPDETTVRQVAKVLADHLVPPTPKD
jgi:hypothetical protein